MTTHPNPINEPGENSVIGETVQLGQSSHIGQTSTTTEQIVMGCLFAPTDPNGLIEVTVRTGEHGKFHVRGTGPYFRDDAEIEEFENAIEDKREKDITIFNVRYDIKLHGTPKCPYLVLKIVNGVPVDLGRSNYMNTMKSVKE